MSVWSQLAPLRADPIFQWLVAAADVLLVAALIYRVLLLIKGTRAVPVLSGVLFLVASHLIARQLGLRTLAWMLGRFLTYGLAFGLIVLFQDEIRRGLAQLGRNSFFSRDERLVEPAVIDQVVAAAEAMAARRVGALVAIERSAHLEPFAESGVRLDARVSQELLRTLFHPGSPLHDGAVIVQRDRVAAARCVLPLGDPAGDRELGTRHLAALGLSEQVDAAVVVVSEERGEIALAVDGGLHRGLDAVSLKRLLLQACAPSPGSGRRFWWSLRPAQRPQARPADAPSTSAQPTQGPA